MKTNGKLINKEILKQINLSNIFACDLTYQNPNVYFELGYAIGKKKPLFVLLNPNVANAQFNYAQNDILKCIGYTTFSNSSQIINGLKGLKKQTDCNHVLLEQITTFECIKTNSSDVFYIQSMGSSQAEMDVLNYINDSTYLKICENPFEISYQPLEWYVNALFESKSIIDSMIDANKINAKNSLFAGIGYALGKKVLLIAPKPYYAPIDYSDILFEYSSAKECVERISSWLPKAKKPKINEENNEDDKELSLLKLGIGCSIAEDEKYDLLDYFIETQSYKDALKTRNSIFYGRKGTGKTAMYIKLSEDYTQKDNIYVIGLKPESTELIEQIKGYEIISDIASKKSVFQLAWKKVLLSNLLMSIYKKIAESNKLEYSPEENAVLDYCKQNKALLTKSFLSTVSDGLAEKSTPNFVENFTNSYIIPMERIITNYLIKTKYIHIIILADNLDKAWDPKSNLDLQSDMILSLLEASGKFQTNLVNRKSSEIVTNSIIFLRKDIYNFILSKSREPDKVTIISHEIEWSSCSNLLKLLINKRIAFALELGEESKTDKIWNEYFEFNKEDPFNKVMNVCLPRPRDIIYFFGKMFESACNNSHQSVTIKDYQYALNSYMSFLYQNLIAEMNAIYPYIKDFIDDFHLKFSDKIELNQFRKLVKNYENDCVKSEQLITDLFINGYLIGMNQTTGEKFFSYDEILHIEESSSRIKLWPFNCNRIFIMQHPRYAKSEK